MQKKPQANKPLPEKSKPTKHLLFQKFLESWTDVIM